MATGAGPGRSAGVPPTRRVLSPSRVSANPAPRGLCPRSVSAFPPPCRHAGLALRAPARLQDGQVLADAEPAGGAPAPAAAAERAGLPAGVGAAAAEGVPGARRGPACRRGHQGEGGGSRRGRGPAALGRGGSHLAPAGRKCAFSGDQFHCHSPAGPGHLSRGIKTGKCVMFNATCSTCEIYGWCPVENSTLPRKPLLAEAENFTLFIKNTVHFTKFNFSKCNTLQTSDPSYFKSCTYDPVFNPSCPVFRVRNMVEAAGEHFGDLALLGGSIGVLIKWDCDLDHPAAQCQPQYFFSLQDTRYNFRTASYYWGSQRQLYRNLLKLYGLRFDISVHGQAGKFSIIPTAVSFGTSIAFFGAATVVCDLVLLYLDAKADLYWKEKFEEVRVGPHGREKVGVKVFGVNNFMIFCPLVKTQFTRSGKILVEQLLVSSFWA
ncbi:P2X purinoceptor 6-like isoform X4 [Manacus candei]|uniref:P2X purinoceptor 6-like isoform X4 n=1 Tax=Manacus candei TaxID=415023 RepID=UPI002226C9B8|nr:P2X purinoceptor 6-like isoform X4 [Manacus candei]